MNEEMKIIIKAMTSTAQEEINRLKQEIEKLSKGAKGASGKMGAVFKGVAKGAAVAVGAIVAVGAALVALGKNSLQAQKEQARLIAAFQAAGSTAEQAAKSYEGLYRFLGDSGKASEAAAHLAKITTNQKDLAEWTKISQGIYATFGDSLPIEGLTEAANETLRVGKVTGTMADALNWAGVSEDAMNAKLATTNSLSEREAMLRQTLNGIYSEAANIYERNNKALLDYNESQARLDTTMAAAGAATMPLLTALNNLGTAFFTALKPALDAIIPPIATFINWIAQAIQSVMSFFSALTGKSSTIKAVGSGIGTAAAGANNLASGMKGAEKAADGAAKAIEEAKKTTQGFDELNIVSSGSGSSGGSGGSGGGGAGAPGYAGGSGLINPAAFSTEVEETESKASSLAEKVKEIFAGLADVFEPSISAWKGAFETVKQSWNNAKPDFIKGAEEIKTGFTTLGTYIATDFVPNVVNAFSTNIAPVIGDSIGFAVEEAGKAFAWLGGYVNTTVNDVILPYLETFKTVSVDVFSSIGNAWQTHGGNLLSSLSNFFKTIRGHLDNFYNNTFKPIWDKVLEVFNFVWENGLKPLVDNFINAVMVIGNELLTLYNAVIAPVVNWILNNIFPIIVNVVNGVIETVGKIIVAISNTVSGIITVIQGIIQFIVGVFTGDWGKAWDGIKNIFSGFYNAIAGILDTWKAVLSGICDFVKNVLAAAFKIAWEAIKLVWSQVVAFFKAVWDGIVSVFTPVGTWFTNVFTTAWNGIKNAWGSVTSWFSNLWNNITKVFANVNTWFSGKFQAAWTAIKNVFSGWGSFFSGLWSKITSTFSSLGTKLGDAIGGAVKAGINKVIGWIESTVNKAIGKINGAIDLINELPGVHIGHLPTLKLPRLAKGGIVDSATIAMIGERGKEAVVPLENNTEWMDKLADRLAARSNAPSKIVLMVDGKELGWASVNGINKITKQTGAIPLQFA